MIIKKIKYNYILQTCAKYFLYITLHLLFTTYRLHLTNHTNIKNPFQSNNGVYYFWHQHIIAMIFFSFKIKTFGHCVVSPSADGKFVGFIAKKLGYSVLYGSSYKTSISLIRNALQILKTEKQLVLVGDGSRGPAKKLQPGIPYLAKKSNLPIIFIECHSQCKLTLKKSWDLFQIPLPFSKIYITIHKPVFPEK